MKILALICGGAAVAGLFPALVAAHTDPASEAFRHRFAFVPYDARIPSQKQAQLTQLVLGANKAGLPLRVAVIARRDDLAPETARYFGKPQLYAQALGDGITRGSRLLVVMPDGYGYARDGKALPHNALADLQAPGATPSTLASHAAAAIQRVAARSGIHLDLPRVGNGKQTQHDRLMLLTVAVAVVAVLGLRTFLRRSRRTGPT